MVAVGNWSLWSDRFDRESLCKQVRFDVVRHDQRNILGMGKGVESGRGEVEAGSSPEPDLTAERVRE